MKSIVRIKYPIALLLLLTLNGCKLFKLPLRTENKYTPENYMAQSDSTNSAKVQWRNYFTDINLIALIDTALKNNQELNITLNEIEVARAEVKARKGEYLPYGSIEANGGIDRAARYTWNGQSEEDLKANPSRAPKYFGDFGLSAVFSWELDIWKKLRNAKKAAAARFLATIEGKNFMVTNLVSEIANSYYELEALDNRLIIIRQNIAIQENALSIIKQQKDAARVTQLAVNRFDAQLLNTQNLQYDVLQQIVETENKINRLTGRFPQPVARNTAAFNTSFFDSIAAGIPSQLLENRPDIKQAEQQLVAAKLDVKVAKANFFPNIRLSAAVGFQAFNPAVWFRPESILYGVFGDLMAPLINQNALKAAYLSARAKQAQAVYNYEQTVLKAYIEVMNQLSGIDNYSKSLNVKSKEVDILTQSVDVSNNLFKSARADYIEVLLTQQEALKSKLEQIEIKQKQLNAEVNIYKALGGGWY